MSRWPGLEHGGVVASVVRQLVRFNAVVLEDCVGKAVTIYFRDWLHLSTALWERLPDADGVEITILEPDDYKGELNDSPIMKNAPDTALFIIGFEKDVHGNDVRTLFVSRVTPIGECRVVAYYQLQS